MHSCCTPLPVQAAAAAASSLPLESAVSPAALSQAQAALQQVDQHLTFLLCHTLYAPLEKQHHVLQRHAHPLTGQDIVA